MKYKIAVQFVQGGEPWEEDYDDAHVTTDAEAMNKGAALVQHFNDTLRPGEKARKFLGARIVGEGESHDWHKVNLITQTRGRQNFDTMRCELCKITGKRFGLGPSVKRDSIYRAKKYAKCAGRPVPMPVEHDE